MLISQTPLYAVSVNSLFVLIQHGNPQADAPYM